MTDKHNHDYDAAKFDGGPLDGDYIYPSVDRMVQIAEALDANSDATGDTTSSSLAASGIAKHDRLNINERYLLAEAMAAEFARIEKEATEPGMIMMVYESLIFKTVCDLHAQTRCRNRYRELSRFFMVGCGILLGLSVYLLSQ